MQNNAFCICNVLKLPSNYYFVRKFLQRYCIRLVAFTRQNDRENYRGFEGYQNLMKGNNNAYKKRLDILLEFVINIIESKYASN